MKDISMGDGDGAEAASDANIVYVPMPVQGNAHELKSKLQARIQELKQKRTLTEPKSRLELLEKRKLKKMERQKALVKKKDNRKMGLDTKV